MTVETAPRWRLPIPYRRGAADRPARELAEVLERVGHVALQLFEHPVGTREVLRRRRTSESQPDGQGDELLLRSVVQIPLEATSFLVLDGDQPLA